MKTFKIGQVIRKIGETTNYKIVGEWAHPYTKESWYQLHDMGAQKVCVINLCEEDTDGYELVEEEEKIKEELNKWYPVVDEGEYWTNADIDCVAGIRTIVTDGQRIFTFQSNKEGWGTMARRGWKYMRIKLD